MYKSVLSIGEVRLILNRISLRNTSLDWGWEFSVREVCSDTESIVGWLICARFRRPDTNTGEIGVGKSREEFISYASHPDSVVKTAYVVLKLTVEHELMEAFRVDGVRVFDPHRSIEQLQSVK